MLVDEGAVRDQRAAVRRVRDRQLQIDAGGLVDFVYRVEFREAQQFVRRRIVEWTWARPRSLRVREW